MSAGRAALHEKFFTIDTHIDTPTARFMKPEWDFAIRHSTAEGGSQCDLPRMAEGGLDALVLAVYSAQTARTEREYARVEAQAVQVFARTRAVIAQNAAQCGLALSADEALEVRAAGKRAFFLSIENAFPLGQEVGKVRKFFELGMRMLGFTHMLNNDLADSSTDPDGPEWGGLSPLGRSVVDEANRLGVVLDGSHASDAATWQMIERSRAPMVLSHTGCKAVSNHPRNVDDDLLRALAAKGGVIQINALPVALAPFVQDGRTGALNNILRRLRTTELTPESRVELGALWEAWENRFPNPACTMEHYVQHVEHAVKIAGIDHVGIGCDFDGGGGFANGLGDVSDYPNITRALLGRGWSEAALAKLWGRNTLRVFRAAAAAANL